MSVNIEVHASKIEGTGVFASSDIMEGQIICQFNGKKVSIEELKEMYKTKKERIDDPFQISEKEYVILDKPDIYFNHSCSPNSGFKGRGILFALKNIKKGDEITYDYSTTEDTDDKSWGVNWTDIWKIKCNCKSENCRKEIRVFSLLPDKIKMEYYKKGALPDFIFDKLSKKI